MASCLCERCAAAVTAGLSVCAACQRQSGYIHGWCGDAICAARVSTWLQIPHDEGISDPCPRCLDALAALLGVDPKVTPLTLCAFHAALVAAGRLP